MNNVFSRPLFKNKFVQRFAEGGIVSTVMGPDQPQEQQAMDILSNVAQQVDATEQNLDAAEGIDEILSSFSGTPKNAQQARAELAEVVGQTDADATPESVLALVQPTMAILEMSRQMSPPGGIASMPMQAPMPQGMPIPAFAVGGEVDMNSIMQKYAAMQGQIPAGYGSDPASGWLALAQLGAGMAQGKTFAEGLSMGTQMAGPYMQQALSDKAKRRDALSQFVADETARQEAQAFSVADREDQQRFQLGLTQKQLDAQASQAELDRKFRAGESRLDRGAQAAISLDTLNQRKYEFDTQWDRDLIKLQMEAESELAQKLAAATSEQEKIRLQNEFEIKKLDIEHRMGLEKIEYENKFKTLERSAAERMVDDYMKGSGLDPNSAEYKELRQSLIKEQLSKSTGTTVNLGDKASTSIITNQNDYETKEVAELNKAAEAARTTRAALAPVRVMLEPVRKGERPAFETGGFGDTRLAAGQAISYIDKTFNLGVGENVNKVLGGDPKAGEVLEASMARLQVAAAEALSRATNLQVGLSQDMFPKLSRTPEGNLMIADILDRTSERTLRLQDYAIKLQRTYGGTIDPAIKPAEYRDELLKSAGVSSFNGYETGKAFDENGKPIMSLNEYRMHLDKTEPLLTSAEIANLQKLSDTAPADWNTASGVWSGATPPSTGAAWEKLPKDTVFEMGGTRYIRTETGIVPVPPGGGR
jgi:hypothetical protein